MRTGEKKDFDAVVVGAGPNGLAAAIVLQQRGLSVLIIEANDTIGGGLRSAQFTLPGFTHDVCSAIHPLAAASPFFSTLPLRQFGLEYIYPKHPAAHPFDDGTCSVLYSSLTETKRQLFADSRAYENLVGSVVVDWPRIVNNLLGPLRFPDAPFALAKFGLKALLSAKTVARRFRTDHARGLFAGMAAHSIMPLENFATSAIALVLMAAGHVSGWPFPKGGAEQIAKALGDYFISLGGKIRTGEYVRSLSQLPSAHAILFDVTPKQLLEIAGYKFGSIYKSQLQRYRYGMGVFKMDWALDGPVPWMAEEVKSAGTIHLGNTFEEIAESERQAWNGKHAEKPFVLLAQHSMFDATRAPAGKHTLWGYCHVPHGSTVDMTDRIENQIERFAPGFKERIVARHSMNTAQMNEYNANYIGGDINGGAITPSQLFTRPALRWSPYRTSASGIYICSSSTPPGGGVHGMCGFHAARRVLREVFEITG
jgi:phytoene dehydrogenase-like protein